MRAGTRTPLVRTASGRGEARSSQEPRCHSATGVVRARTRAPRAPPGSSVARTMHPRTASITPNLIEPLDFPPRGVPHQDHPVSTASPVALRVSACRSVRTQARETSGQVTPDLRVRGFLLCWKQLPPPRCGGSPSVPSLALLVFDFIATRKPHEVSMKEATAWSAFYIALPLAFGVYVWNAHGFAARARVLHRLPRGEDAQRRQPVRVHAAARRLRRAQGPPAAGAALRHRRRARAARHLHRPRRCRPRPLRLGLPGLRRRPAAHRAEAAPGRDVGPRPRDGRRRHAHRAPHAAPDAGDQRLRGQQDGRGARGSTLADPAGPGRHRRVRHGRRVRRRLGARGLRHHRRPLPRLRDQRLRPARPARALLRAPGRTGEAGAPVVRPRRDPRLHRREAGPALGPRRVARGPVGADAGLAGRDRRRSW